MYCVIFLLWRFFVVVIFCCSDFWKNMVIFVRDVFVIQFIKNYILRKICLSRGKMSDTMINVTTL